MMELEAGDVCAKTLQRAATVLHAKRSPKTDILLLT